MRIKAGRSRNWVDNIPCALEMVSLERKETSVILMQELIDMISGQSIDEFYNSDLAIQQQVFPFHRSWNRQGTAIPPAIDSSTLFTKQSAYSSLDEQDTD